MLTMMTVQTYAKTFLSEMTWLDRIS